MLTFLLVVHAIITAILVVVILMQRSEGGGLGMGGSPTGLMSARGAADFLTRATTILATLFVLLSIASAVVASRSSAPGKIDTSLQRSTPTGDPAAPPPVSNGSDPLSAVAGQVSNGAVPVTGAPAQTPAAAPALKSDVPASKGDQKAGTPARPAPRETAAPTRTPPPPVVPTTLPSIAPKAEPAPAPTGPSNSN
jgi:preprotein translocase subunit SecG